MVENQGHTTNMNVVPPAPSPRVTQAELEAITHRSELAIRALGAVSEVLAVDVNVPTLLYVVENKENEERDLYLTAHRALRCIDGISKPGSPVIQAIGEAGVYHYVEGVIMYGARDSTYLELMDRFQISAEEATGLYSLREIVAEQSNGQKRGFDEIFNALAAAGIEVQEAAQDPYEAIANLDERGFFVDNFRGRTFDQPRLIASAADGMPRLIPDDYDGSVSKVIIEHARDYFGRPPEERED